MSDKGKASAELVVEVRELTDEGIVEVDEGIFPRNCTAGLHNGKFWPGNDTNARSLSGRVAGMKVSDFDGGAADATFLQLPALPACDRNEEQCELLEFPHPCPLCGVVAVRARSGLPRAKVLPLGAVTE